MQQFTVTPEDVSGVFAQLTAEDRVGVYYDSLPGMIFAPDDKAAAVQAAMAANVPADHVIKALKDYAAAKRFEKEVAGTNVNVSGAKWVVAATDRDSQAMLTSAYVLAQSNSDFTAKWKQPDGSFADLNAAEIMVMGLQAAVYVGTCFALESQCVDGIDGETITTTAQIDDIFASWP